MGRLLIFHLLHDAAAAQIRRRQSIQVAGQVTTDPAQNVSALVLTGDSLDALADDPDDLVADLQALAGPAAGLNGPQFFIDGFSAGDAVLPAKQSIRT